jgi:hypothetical protein
METQIVTESMLYWITRLDGIKGAIVGIGAVLIIVFVVSTWIFSMLRFVDKKQWATKRMIGSLTGIVLSSLFMVSNIFIPTTKEMCAIKAIPMVVNDKQVQELPIKVIDLANEWLDSLKPINKNTNN